MPDPKTQKPDHWLVRFKREGADRIDRLIVKNRSDAEKQVMASLIIDVTPIFEIVDGRAFK